MFVRLGVRGVGYLGMGSFFVLIFCFLFWRGGKGAEESKCEEYTNLLLDMRFLTERGNQ